MFGQGSIPAYEVAVRQIAGKLAMIGETRLRANCCYVIPICQTLNQARICSRRIQLFPRAGLVSELQPIAVYWIVAHVSFGIRSPKLIGISGISSTIGEFCQIASSGMRRISDTTRR
jgi:hypothetical protein